ncbi:MAG: hypothetical protein WCF90_06590 [Methanomicrobiales archaeon]
MARVLWLRSPEPVRDGKLVLDWIGPGVMGEFQGQIYPNYAINVGRQGEFAAIGVRAHLGRLDALCVDARVTIPFTDPSLKFDFAELI